MRKMHFLLIWLLLFSCVAVSLTVPINADNFRGTRSPDAGVRIIPPSNQTGKPTETLSYLFEVNNAGDETDNFTVVADSERDWLMNWSDHVVGPLDVDESTFVTVNITIPMGEPANTVDNLTFTATSIKDGLKANQTVVNTTVIQSFVIEIEIEGRTSWTSSADPGEEINYTLILRNKGNFGAYIDINYNRSIDWDVAFQPSDRRVFVEKAVGENEGIETVNVTVIAPLGAVPDSNMTLTVWGEKTDTPPFWYSWQHQENITLTTVIQASLSVDFSSDITEGFVHSGVTVYNFTIENTGNKDLKIDFTVDRNPTVNAILDDYNITLGIGERSDIIRLSVWTASMAPLGNYTINITASDNETGLEIGSMEVYYIIVPILNITDIFVSESEPMQYRSTTLSATIENIGYVEAKNITVKFYDGSKKIGEDHLEAIIAGEEEEAEIKWSPSDFGNRTIRVSIDVDGIGNFTSHGSDIAEGYTVVKVKVNWQPYYLVIYVIIVVILGVAFLPSAFELRYYGGRPIPKDYDEGLEEEEYEEYPKEDQISEGEGEEADRPFAPLGVSEETEEGEEDRLRYEEWEKKAVDAAPFRGREEPFEMETPRAKDQETIREENRLKDDISKIQDRLGKAKSLGVDTASIDQLLKTAKRSLDEDTYDKAKQYIGYANERLETLMAKRDGALEAIKEARDVLSGMRGTTDLTIVENFLVKADSLFEEGNYREAMNYANKAKDRAKRLQRREMRL